MGKEIGITVKKSDDFSEWYTQLVIKAELADYAPVKGLIVLRPDGYSIWESLKSSLDSKLAATGHRNGFLPVLIPESLLGKEKDHFAGFNPEVFWVTRSGDGEIGDKLALRPTSETLAYTMYAKWIRSWRDLPLKINFWNSALRAEIKATKPFLRTSEFLWQEGHTAHATKKEAIFETEQMINVYAEFTQNFMAMPVIVGLKSEKERFAGAEETYCIEALMQDGKALQAGTSHFLGQNFAKAFDVKFTNKQGKQEFVWATSWGVSTRLMGALIMTHSDDNGLVLPPKLAPFQVVIIPVFKEKKQLEALSLKVNEIKKSLEENGVSVKYDNRETHKPGWKFAEYELKGVPLRLTIGPRDLENGTIEIVRRDTLEKKFYKITDVETQVKIILDEIQENLYKKALNFRETNTYEANTKKEFEELIKKGGFVYAHWDGTSETEDLIKQKTKATIRCIPIESNNKPGMCLYTGKPSEKQVLFAKNY